jgi:dolichol-phosphate mannosyltransferase
MKAGSLMFENAKVGLVIPCFKVRKHLLEVIASIPKWVDSIYLIDDACPENSVQRVMNILSDSRIKATYLKKNSGVGFAVKQGYLMALDDNQDIIVRIDGDGQMDLSYLAKLINPLIMGEAAFSKGNRFFDIDDISKMPKARIIGNVGLSFMSKFSTGFWDIFDPNNGYHAITNKALKQLPLDKIDNRYFFESDQLFRLGLNRTKIIDVSIPANYGNEVSNLNILQAFFEFNYKHIRNFWKRIYYNYFLRDFNLGSLEFILGSILLTFGLVTGAISWIIGINSGIPTPIGRLMLVAMATLSGLQFILGFLAYDMNRQTLQTAKNP